MNLPIFYIFFFIIVNIFTIKIFKKDKLIKKFILNLILIQLFYSYFNFSSDTFILNFYLVLSLNIFFIWFYYTFVKGFSSKIILLIHKYKNKRKVKETFFNIKKKNIIIEDRLSYLKRGKYLKRKDKKLILSNKAKIIACIHNFISILLDIKKSGGIDN